MFLYSQYSDWGLFIFQLIVFRKIRKYYSDFEMTLCFASTIVDFGEVKNGAKLTFPAQVVWAWFKQDFEALDKDLFFTSQNFLSLVHFNP